MDARGAARTTFERLIGPVILLVIIGVVIIFVGFLRSDNPPKASSNDITPFAVDEALPVSSLLSRDGDKVELANVLPAKAVVTFWSATCQECTQLLTDQNELLAPSLPILLVNIQDTPADGEAKLAALGVKFPSYYDDGGVTFRAWEGTIPASYYIEQGRIKYFFPGRMSREYMQALLK